LAERFAAAFFAGLERAALAAFIFFLAFFAMRNLLDLDLVC
jgi:hypothetical protein